MPAFPPFRFVLVLSGGRIIRDHRHMHKNSMKVMDMSVVSASSACKIK